MTSCSANAAVAWPGNMACRGPAYREFDRKCLRTGTAFATPRLRTSAQLVGWQQPVRKKPLPISADMSICVCSASTRAFVRHGLGDALTDLYPHGAAANLSHRGIALLTPR